MGQMHAKVYQALPDVEIVGIVDSKPAIKEIAPQHGVTAPVFATLSDLLKQAEVDAIDVCLPTDLHAETVIAAAQAGKHVFCEKPLTLEVADARRMVDAVAKNNVFFQVGQCIRFWPEYQALLAFVKSGQGGKLVSLALQRRASRPTYCHNNWLHIAERSKGAALDLHIHDTDFVLFLLGTPKAVHSIGRKEKGSYCHIFTNYMFDDVAVTAEGGWDLPAKWGFQMAFQAVFENAILEFDILSSPTMHLTLGDEPRKPFPFEKPQVKSNGPSSGNISDLGGYYNELAYFCQCIATSKKPEIATGQQALESLRVTLAEIQSADEKKIVSLS